MTTEATVERAVVPRAALIGAAGLIVLTLLLAGAARIVEPPSSAPAVAVVSRVDLHFTDRADGGIEVFMGDAPGDRLDTFAPETNGFLRGVLRGLVRERRRSSIGSTLPFTLTRWADGRLSLDDPATGQHVDLEVFGPTNALPFVELITKAESRNAP